MAGGNYRRKSYAEAAAAAKKPARPYCSCPKQNCKGSKHTDRMQCASDLRYKECQTVFVDKERIPESLHPIHSRMLAQDQAKGKHDEETPMQVDLDTADRENRDGIKKQLEKKQLLRDGLEEDELPVPDKLREDIKRLRDQLDDDASEDPDVAGLYKTYMP